MRICELLREAATYSQINQLTNLRVQRAVGETEYKLRQRIAELEKELRELKAAIKRMAAAA
jgi:ribosomal protein L29